MMKKMASFIFWIVLAGTANAKDIYRWVDDDGHTHIEDSVPARYKSVASKIDSRQFELTERQRAQAAARARQDEEKARQADTVNVQPQPQPKAAQALPAGLPRQGEKSAAECERLWKAYKESQECFAPFMRLKGGTRSEAYDKCTQVADPSADCDIPGN